MNRTTYLLLTPQNKGVDLAMHLSQTISTRFEIAPACLRSPEIIMDTLKHFTLRRLLLSALVLVGTTVAMAAAPIPGSLSITGSVALDTSSSYDPTGGATQSGTLKQVMGGVVSTSSFLDIPSTITSSLLGGPLTHIGDGIGASFSMSGNYVDTDMTTDGLFADFTLDLNNTSAFTYTVTFAAVSTNGVGAAGDNAYAQSMISVFDGANDEVLFSDYRIDTLNNDANSNFEATSANSTFSVTLLPGESASFSALQQQFGGVFAAGNYSANLDAFLRVNSVTLVPEPGALPMMSLGLLVVALTQRRRRRG